MKDQNKRRLWLLWRRCRNDAKNVFKQSRVGLVQGEINALLNELDTKDFSATVCGDRNEVLDRVAIVPADPTKMLSTENLLIVLQTDRKNLIRVCRKQGMASYVLMLDEMV